MNLSKFTSDNLFNATTDFFGQLDIKLNSNTAQTLDIKAILGNLYKDKTPFVNISALYFAGLIDDSVLDKNTLFDSNVTLEEAEAKSGENYDSLMIFAVQLDKTPNRTEISEITRAFNRKSLHKPVAVLFYYDNKISLALPERFLYKQTWRDGEKVGKIIILRDISVEENKTHAGHLRILENLAKHNAHNFNELHEAWLKVLNIKTLNDTFYARLAGKYNNQGKLIVEGWYQRCFNAIEIDLTAASRELGKKIDEELKPQAVIRIIIRMMFLWFMKEKKLIENKFFTREFAVDFLKNENTYYNAILQNLFFAVLNKKIDERRFHTGTPNDYGIFDVFRYKSMFNIGKADEFLKLTKSIPFVNGGLFQCHDYKFKGKDEKGNRNTAHNYLIDGFSEKTPAKISDSVFFELIDLFNDFVFTIEESTPTEQDIALDPELLGTVFENIIASYNPETKDNARKQTGSFYTPREIVDYMCKESLKETLKTTLPDLQNDIELLIENHEDQLNFPQKNKIIAAITDLKVLDPACGSGAFPMGMFNLMVRTIEKLQEQKTTYKNKLDIITNCIYGIDIQNIAVEISKLRFFISLLVDYPTPQRPEDFDVLPNLETKFVVANSLIGIDLKQKEGELFDFTQPFRELAQIFTPFTTAKTPKEKETIKNNFENKKREILSDPHFGNDSGVKDKILAWNPFNVCYCSPFFDTAIMFGIADGFDIVIGNPPYGASYPDAQKAYFKTQYKSAKTNSNIKMGPIQKGSLDTFSLFIEKGFDLLVKNGSLNYIVPMSVISMDSMTGLHKVIMSGCSKIKISSYGFRPKQIFPNSASRTSIIFFTKDNKLCQSILTTKMNRWNKDISLQELLNKMSFTEASKNIHLDRIPKISDKIESAILDKILFSKNNIPVTSLLKKTKGSPIFYRSAGNLYYYTITNYTTNSSAEKSLLLKNKDIANCIGTILSSNLFFWYCQVFGDNRNLRMSEIDSFTIPQQLIDGKAELSRIYSDYLIDIEKNAIPPREGSKRYANLKEYKLVKSKHLIDQIDDLICPLYGLTQEEKDFIKNYEIEFRLSGEE
ncbi:hypothetical protein AGMMS49982_03590 [Bacteroidia bacterium]|nr:hypothetical protein AGMMS49982_03590 [Bacteroidia bacterium]